MKKFLLLTFLSLFLLACAEKAKEGKSETEGNQDMELAEDTTTSPLSTDITEFKHGTITGTNVILRASPSTNSEKLDVLKGAGEKVKILETLTAGNSAQAITKEELKITIGNQSVTLPKGKAVKILSRNNESQKATVSFNDLNSKERTADLDYKNLEFINDSDWYKVETQQAKIGWVFGKFITEGAVYSSNDFRLNSKKILLYSTPEDEEEYAEEGSDDWAYFTHYVFEYFKEKHPGVEFGDFPSSDLSSEDIKRLEKKLNLEGFGYVLIDGERSHFLVHNMYDEVIEDTREFFGFKK